MYPTTIPERMMYTTVLIRTDKMCGTGSFFTFEIDGKEVAIIITNMHVVNYKEQEEVTIKVHTKDSKGNPNGNEEIKLKITWYFHERQDICFCFADEIFEKVKRDKNKDVFYESNTINIIPSQYDLEQLSPLEELTMVGYPILLWDENNNYPVFRKGYAACHPAIDFNREGIGLVDMACFPGSSGSPVYVYNGNGYCDKRGNVSIGTPRVMLLGFLVSGPSFGENGKTVTHLGYYIKALEILCFGDIVKKLLSKNQYLYTFNCDN